MSEWQTIDSLPERQLALVTDGTGLYLRQWWPAEYVEWQVVEETSEEKRLRRVIKERRKEFANEDGAFCPDDLEGDFTHWMPLPEPPDVVQHPRGEP